METVSELAAGLDVFFADFFAMTTFVAKNDYKCQQKTFGFDCMEPDEALTLQGRDATTTRPCHTFEGDALLSCHEHGTLVA